MEHVFFPHVWNDNSQLTDMFRALETTNWYEVDGMERGYVLRIPWDRTCRIQQGRKQPEPKDIAYNDTF